MGPTSVRSPLLHPLLPFSPDPRIAVAPRMCRLGAARRPDDIVDKGSIGVAAGWRLCSRRRGGRRVVIVVAGLLREGAEEDAALAVLRLACLALRPRQFEAPAAIERRAHHHAAQHARFGAHVSVGVAGKQLAWIDPLDAAAVMDAAVGHRRRNAALALPVPARHQRAPAMQRAVERSDARAEASFISEVER
jgi:hypothetical protein